MYSKIWWKISIVQKKRIIIKINVYILAKYHAYVITVYMLCLHVLHSIIHTRIIPLHLYLRLIYWYFILIRYKKKLILMTKLINNYYIIVSVVYIFVILYFKSLADLNNQILNEIWQ